MVVVPVGAVVVMVMVVRVVVVMMVVIVMVVVMRVPMVAISGLRRAFTLGPRDHHQTRTGQRLVVVSTQLDPGVAVDPGPRERRRQLGRERGECVEQRGGEHVAGDATDRVQMDMHDRHCR